GPVRQLLVGTAAAVANQRDVVAKAPLDQALGELDGGIEVVRILKLRSRQQQLRPVAAGRQIVAREGIDVRAGAEASRPPGALTLGAGSQHWLRQQASEHGSLHCLAFEPTAARRRRPAVAEAA